MSIIAEKRNCWRVDHASRAACLVDAASYFSAFTAALESASRSVMIVGWDIDSRTRLIRKDESVSRDVTLGGLLEKVVERSPELEIRLLIWDYAFIKVMERELWLTYKLGWKTHPRIHFSWDNAHPLGASHHQKMVVIDDQLAFCGGIDLSKWRWDTPEHRFDDPRRIDPVGNRYKPYHDVQMMVEGDAARALGDLARERWHRAGGLASGPVEIDTASSLWPKMITPQFQDVEVAISRTDPVFKGRSEVREIEQLYLDSIREAKQSIYIENQYTTSHAVGDALAERLQESDGPEVVVVTHVESGGWLEKNTMDVLRSRWIKRLQEADRHDRFRIYYPHLPDYANQCLTVHAKVMIVDDCFLRVGSSNLCNRSMGLDTECDLSVEVSENEAERTAMTTFRNTLIAEHTGQAPQAIKELIDRNGSSLIDAIDSLGDHDRSLRQLDGTVSDWRDRQVPESTLIDPETAVDSDWFRDQWTTRDTRKNAFWISLRFILTVLFLLGLAAAWRWTPLNQYVNLDTLLNVIEIWRQTPWLPFLLFGGFVIGGCLGVPVTLMVTIVAIVYPPWRAFALSYGATMVSASISFGIGNLLGKEFIDKLAGNRVREVSRKLARQGILVLALLRLLPIAPFTVINTVGGASHVRFRDFLLGTLLGSIPGTLAVTFFVSQLRAAARDPKPEHFIMATAIGLVFVGITWGFGRWIKGKTGGRREDSA